MNAVIRISADEFDESLFKHIKGLLSKKDDLEITISIGKIDSGILRNETNEQYETRLLQAKAELENGKNKVSFKASEFDEFQKFLLNEP